MRKHFILSTRTVVSKRNVTQSFGSDNTIIIPMAVLDEVQTKYATQHTERGKIAEELLKYLSDNYGIKKLHKGVIQPNGSFLKVTTNYSSEELNETVNETELTKIERRVLQTCVGIKKEVPADEPVILVSKNPLLRMKAELLGVKAQTFRDELLPEIHEQYTGRKEIFVSDEQINEFYKNKKIRIEDIIRDEKERKEVYPNMFIQMKGTNGSAIGRVSGEYIVKLVFTDYHPYGVIPKNVGQRFMIEALMMDEEIAPFVIIKGPAGTAKTFLAIAAGLEQVEEQGKFPEKILISRSPTETGEKLGFLPGGESEKIEPYMRGVKDSIGNLYKRSYDETEPKSENVRKKGDRTSDKYDEKPQYEDGMNLFERRIINAEAIGYIRGRTITDTYIIIDEAQNLTPVEVKTIVTRVGTGTKLVLIGDPAQIDRPELDERNNGLSYASERFKGDEDCWQITMKESESVRSKLARKAAMLL